MQRVWGVLALGLLLAAPAAHAAGPRQFYFEVPVRVSRVAPEFRSVDVMCWIHAGSRTYGQARQRRNLANGGYQGKVTVAVAVEAGRDGADVDHYSCSLLLVGDRSGPVSQYYETAGRRSGKRDYEFAPGTTSRVATGRLPLP